MTKIRGKIVTLSFEIKSLSMYFSNLESRIEELKEIIRKSSNNVGGHQRFNGWRFISGWVNTLTEGNQIVERAI
ncbi:hypothetical protein ACFVT8_06025 [Lysinibacillus sp. NPDC058147]|uniref:hypothetical protein n=1 Tax=unclassified Lysinibacillus TaxID=2636778 RepID=UPI0036DF545C